MRYPEHAPPASCHEGDLPSTVILMDRSLTGLRQAKLASRFREGVGRRRALGPEHERQLALGRETSLRRPECGTRLAQVHRAKHVLVEVAVFAARGLRLR